MPDGCDVDYVARETVSNLWRNRLMTIAAMLTVAVSLSLVGASLLLRQGVAHATTQWQHGVNVLVWLTPGDERGVGASRSPPSSTSSPYVRACIYRDQAYDFNEAKHLLPPDESQALSRGRPSRRRCAARSTTRTRRSPSPSSSTATPG